MEAPNPFNQQQLQENDPANESLGFGGNFWKEESNGAYDDDNAYQAIGDEEDNSKDKQNKSKSNPISNLFNNVKSKLSDNDKSSKPATNHFDGKAYDNEWIEEEEEISKPSQNEGPNSNLLTTNQIGMVCEYAISRNKRTKKYIHRHMRN